MKISCTPISVMHAILSGEPDQKKYFELPAAAGADGTGIPDTPSSSCYAAGNSFTVRTQEGFDRQAGIGINGIHEAAGAIRRADSTPGNGVNISPPHGAAEPGTIQTGRHKSKMTFLLQNGTENRKKIFNVA